MADESREIRKNRAIRRLRWVTLLATVAAVAAVVALFVHGHRQSPPQLQDEPKAETVEPTGELVTVGEGFEQTFSEGDRKVFTVRGDRYAVDREGAVYLDGVEVTIYREDGSEYRIEARKARFDIEKQEGTLEGGVRISAPGGMELETPHLEVSHHAKQIRSNVPVEFRIGDSYGGQAEGLEAWPARRRFVLLGNVKIVSLPGAAEPLRLDGQGLVLDRTRNMVQARRGATLRRRGERISALRMDVFFAEDGATVRFILAMGKVQGFLRSGGGGTLENLAAVDTTAGAEGPEPQVRRIAFRTEKLTLLLTKDGRHPEKFELERGIRGRATLRTLGPPDVPRYRLAAPVITTWFTAGVPEHSEATGGVVLVMDEPRAGDGEEQEVPSVEEDEEGGDAATGAGETTPDGRRQATAQQAEARFDEEGRLAAVVLDHDVVLTAEAVEATGDRGVFRVGEGEEIELLGRPAVATSARGRMEAPRILYTRDTGLVHGTGGVRARLEEAGSSALAGSPLARGDGPIWVEADDGYLREQPRSFLFRGEVRAWRGEDLLVSDELHGDDAEDRLTATGNVRTSWTPETEEAGQTPLQVAARELVYRGSERILVYTGDVVAEQEERIVACDELVVELAEAGGMKRLVCTGAVRVEDPGQGRSLHGGRAVYDPAGRTVDVTAAEGGKVTMKDRDGNVVEGPRMTYDIDSGHVRVIGPDGEPPPAGTEGPAPGTAAGRSPDAAEPPPPGVP